MFYGQTYQMKWRCCLRSCIRRDRPIDCSVDDPISLHGGWRMYYSGLIS